MKVVLVCSVDAAYRKYVAKEIKKVVPEAVVKKCKSQGRLFRLIRKFDGMFIVCDKFFLGLRLEEKLLLIRGYMNKTSKVMVTAWHVEDCFFGVRLKNLGFDGFLNDIGKDGKLAKGLTEFFRSGKYFDDKTEQEFLNRTLDSHSKFVGDVVTDEILTVLKVRSSFFDELKDSSGKYSTMHNRINNFKKKIGIVSDEELDEVIQLMKKGVIL